MSVQGLRQLASDAARRYKETGVDLNTAVVSVLRGQKLNEEQIRRIVEKTNRAAYLDEFERAQDRKNVVFPGGPADPRVVLRELSDQAVRLPVQSHKQAAVGSRAGGQNAMKKTAMVEETDHRSVNPTIQYELLVKQASELTNAVNRAQLEYDNCRQQLLGAVKLAHAGGTNPNQIRQAIAMGAGSVWGANLALYEMDSHMEFPTAGGMKIAGRMVQDHPLILAVKALEKVAYDLKICKEAQRMAKEELSEFLSSFS